MLKRKNKTADTPQCNKSATREEASTGCQQPELGGLLDSYEAPPDSSRNAPSRGPAQSVAHTLLEPPPLAGSSSPPTPPTPPLFADSSHLLAPPTTPASPHLPRHCPPPPYPNPR
ncbi:hypothetical protein E2C01_033451 [Portunus trituberculatus]|uniref:Uncharacterized protein n=1 Tax=Portunus trituberculatus TaxID=210409 RepID=A0A5B7EXX2_PORTR|nr:hypothetical protein [Portunus trituberculatus]